MTRPNRSVLAVFLSWVLVAACVRTAGDAPAGQAGASSPDGLPAGWQMRVDNPNDAAFEIAFKSTAAGFEATMGPAAIFYQEKRTFSGPFTISASLTQLKRLEEGEGYGLFVGGSDLQGPQVRYTYFLLRQDGKFLVKQRAAYQTPVLVDWKSHDAIKAADEGGRMTNVLAIDVQADATRFLINGTEVARRPNSEIETRGVAGLRVNRHLNVLIEQLTFTPDSPHVAGAAVR